MTKQSNPEETVHTTRMFFTSIAFWQFASFFMLFLLIWVNQVLDLPSLIYGTKSAPMDFFGAALLSSFVIITAVITVGHTYVQQQRVLSGFITVCAKCHKVKINQQVWKGIERYIADYCPVTFSHGLCPDCYSGELAELKKNRPAAAGKPAT